MSITKKLATDTVAYGVSSILARIINFLFGFLIIKFISPAEFGTYTNFYAYAGFILVVLTHGMETAYFRFVNKEESKETAFSTAFYSILFVVILFVLITYLFQKPIAAYVKEPTFYLQLFVWMMAFDTLAAIPFASLRKQGRPMVFAGLKILNILFFILLNILFFIILPKLNLTLNVTSVSYIFIANLVASILTFIILLFQFRQLKFSIDFSIYKKMLWYAMPIMLVGFAGMINEVLDRIIMTRLLPGSLLENKIQLGIYGFNYKFAMIISMFLQAYRFAAEPLFFKNAEKEDNKEMLAKTMKFYTISVCFIFLTITLFMPLIQFSFSKYSPSSATYFEGVGIVPILLMANIFLGIYFNISTWYKITDKTYVGAFISIVGAAVTIVMNIVLVPKIGYFGGAWATLACYATMLIIGYITEQKYYPIPYDYKRILFYLAIAVGFYFVLQYLILPMQFSLFINTIIAFCFLLLYVFVAYFLEKKKVIA